MSEPLPIMQETILVEQSVQIAWHYLERTGELSDAIDPNWFLRWTIEKMVRQGEHRRLLLSNRAIAEYCRRKQAIAA
jgi:hypothetical protein